MTFGPKMDGGARRRHAIELFASGRNYNQIAKQLHVGPETVHRWVDPVYAAHRKRQINECRYRRGECRPK